MMSKKPEFSMLWLGRQEIFLIILVPVSFCTNSMDQWTPDGKGCQIPAGALGLVLLGLQSVRIPVRGSLS